MNAVDEKGLAIASEFEMFDEWMDKDNYLIELGKSLPLIDEKDKTTSNLISGCQSRVWLSANYENGKVYFKGDSDAIITKGIVSVLIRSMDGAGVDDIIASELDWLDNTGLKEHLSPTRSNGLVAMIKQMKLYAMAFKVKYENK